MTRQVDTPEELAARIAAAGASLVTPTDKPRPTFLRSSLRDPAFFAANQKAIEEAARDNRVIDDVSVSKWGSR